MSVIPGAIGDSEAKIIAGVRGENEFIITVKLSEQKTAECVVMVRKVPQNIALNKTSLRLEEGQSLTLSAELTPSYAYTIIIWSSSDETVADVNENGEITAKKAGAGTLVPITGFANSVASPAIEFKSEGYVLGLGAKMFTIAGPVIVYGTLAGAVYGLILLLSGR